MALSRSPEANGLPAAAILATDWKRTNSAGPGSIRADGENIVIDV
jgi:hypothetical protein